MLVTYEPGGGYGHPDHVQAHRVAMRAAALAKDGDGHGAKDGDGDSGRAWQVPKVYWTALPQSRFELALRAVAGQGGQSVRGLRRRRFPRCPW